MRKLPRMRRAASSCSNVSCMPRSFAPPQPKQWFDGFGLSSIRSPPVSQNKARLPAATKASAASAVRKSQTAAHERPILDDGHARGGSLRDPRSRLRISDFRMSPENLNAASDALLVQVGKTQAQSIRARLLEIKKPPVQKVYAAARGRESGVRRRRSRAAA